MRGNHFSGCLHSGIGSKHYNAPVKTVLEDEKVTSIRHLVLTHGLFRIAGSLPDIGHGFINIIGGALSISFGFINNVGGLINAVRNLPNMYSGAPNTVHSLVNSALGLPNRYSGAQNIHCGSLCNNN